MYRRGISLFTILVIAALFPIDAYGYLDPGTGSLIIQLTLAAFFGALFWFKAGFHWLKRVFGRGKAKSVSSTSAKDAA